MGLVRYVTFVIILVTVGAVAMEPELVKDFFELKNVRMIYLKPANVKEALRLTTFLSVRSQFYTTILRNTSDVIVSRLPATGKIGVYLDCSCEENTKFLQQVGCDCFTTDFCNRLAEELGLPESMEPIGLPYLLLQLQVANPESFGLRMTWLIDFSGGGENDNILRRIDLRFINEVTVAFAHPDPLKSQTVLLYSAYTQHLPFKKLRMLPEGYWTGKEGLVYSRPQRKYSLEKAQFNSAILMTQNIYGDEFLYEELQNRTYMANLDTANRFYFSIALHVADLFNFSIHLVWAKEWGSRLPDGNFTGMTGMLTNGTVDWIIGPTRLLAERLDTMSPMFPLQMFKFPFAFKQTKKTGTYRAMAHQLRGDTWVMTAVVAIIACLILSSMQFVRNKLRGSNYFQTEDQDSLSFGVVVVVGAFSQQGLMTDPPDIPRRIACSFILFLSTMVFTYYNAATMNALLTPSPPSIQNLQQLVASDIPLALNRVPYFTLPEARSKLFTSEVIVKVNRSNLGFLNLDDGLSLVLKSGAFCAEDFTLYKGIHALFTDAQKCDLSIIDATPPIPAMYWTHKNSTYKEMMYQGTLRAKEHGLVDRQLKYWYPRKPECVVKQQWLWVGMEAVSIALGIFTAGLLASIALLNVELVTAYFQRK